MRTILSGLRALLGRALAAVAGWRSILVASLARGGDNRRSRRLRARARARGLRDMRQGVVDRWSFSEDPPPFLYFLLRDRDRLIAERREVSLGEQAAQRQRAASDAAHARAVDAELAPLITRHHEAHDQLRVARARIDRVAEEEALRGMPADLAGAPFDVEDIEAIRALRDSLNEDLLDDPADGAAHDGRDAEADDADPAAAKAPGSASGGPPGPVVDGDTAHDPEPVPESVRRDDQRWEGEHGGLNSAPSRALSAGLLLLLGAVELPIQYTIFRRFTDYSPGQLALTIFFVAPLTLVLIIAPHIAGRRIRDRHATGAERHLIRWLAPAMAGLAGLVYVVLGYLRADVLLELRKPSIDPTTNLPFPTASGTGPLHVNMLTMTAMFTAFLLLSGAISFVMGVGRPHPLVASYLHARDRRDRVANRLARARARRGLRTLHLTHDDATWDERRDNEERKIREQYRAAAHAYLDGIAAAARDATVTQEIVKRQRDLDNGLA